jgi:hypothetical protein
MARLAPRRMAKLARGGVDACRLLGPVQRPPGQLTWPLEPEDRSRLEVRWPRRYEWPHAGRWVLPLRHGMERLVSVVEHDIPQRHQGVVAIQIKLDDTVHDVILDYWDFPHYDPELLDRVSLYFKMQCPPDADARVIPGGFVPRSEQLYRYLRRLRRTRARADFEYHAYGRFGLSFATTVRSRAISMLAAQDRFRYEGGAKLIAYPSYLREIARSRVCVDLPGNGFLCFRQLDYLAVGSCVIGPKPRVVYPVPPVDRREVVYAREDLSDLIELCERYVFDDAARERVAANARAYFDRYLHRDQLAAYYLYTAVRRLASHDRERRGGRWAVRQ